MENSGKKIGQILHYCFPAFQGRFPAFIVKYGYLVIKISGRDSMRNSHLGMVKNKDRFYIVLNGRIFYQNSH